MESIEWKKWGRTLSFFFLSRYPIVNGLSFLMLLGERAKRETEPPFDPNVIYGHIGILIGAGLAMGFNFRRKPAAFIHIIQLVYLAYSIQTNTKLLYKDWLRAKICVRMLGTTGFFLLYAFFTSTKPRPQYLRRIGETIIGIYVGCFLYQLVSEPVEKDAFLRLAIGGTVSLYIVAIILAACVLCYIPGLFVIDITQALLLSLWFTTVAVDARLHYWTKRIGVDYWVQVRLISDHVAMMLGCIMYLTCTKKVLSVDGPLVEQEGDEDLEVVDQLPLDRPEHHAHPDPQHEDFIHTPLDPQHEDLTNTEQTENQLNELTEQQKKKQ